MKLWVFLLLACVVSAQQPASEAEDKDLSNALSEAGSSQIDFEEMLTLLKSRFGIDVHGSLGVKTDEDALFLLYQLALRDSYAPGDAGANVHVLVLKPTGPAARLPWFAA